MQHISASLPKPKRRQRAGQRGRCRRHEKIHGRPPGQRLDGNVKARLIHAANAYNARFKQPRQHWGPITRAAFKVFETLLYKFHHNRNGGFCFPSYERGAATSRCHRDTFYEAIKVLEEAGLLTWVNRIVKISVVERDLFGHRVRRKQVIRTSNAYRFIDPLDRDPGRQCRKSENPMGPDSLFKQESKKETGGGARLDAAPVYAVGETSEALMLRSGWHHSGGKKVRPA